MNRNDYKNQMTEVYGNIYKDYYKYENNVMQQARYFILKNLERLGGVDTAKLKSMTILNVGTGRETLVFHELGANKIFHFDISNKSVEALTKLKKPNIKTKQLDICGEEELDIDEKIDIVYLHGIVIHLHDPALAMSRIFKTLNERTKMFLSLYRSGSFVFFIVDFIRKFISFSDWGKVDILFKEKFPFSNNEKLQGESSGKVNEERFHSLYSCMCDDFFVPKVGLYNIKSLHDYFKLYGFSPLKDCDRDFREYDHTDSGIPYQSPLLFLERTSMEEIKAIPDFPCHVDQMKDITYKEDFIINTIELMGEFLKGVFKMTPDKRIDVALDIYNIAHKEYGKTDDAARQRHSDIQAILLRELNQDYDGK